jgi:hypothetical protein
MQRACAARDFQEIFRLVNRRAGASYADIAAAVGKITSARVGDVIHGVRGIGRSPEMQGRIADAFGIPGQLLGLPRRTWEDEAVQVPIRATAEDIDRVEPWELLDTLTRSELSPEALRGLEAAVLKNATLYPSSPPGQLIPTMTLQLAKINRVLSRPQSLRTRRRCIQILGTLSGLAGNAFIDVNDLGQSAALFDVGSVAADEAEDPALLAWLLTLQSIGPFFSKRPEEAVALLTQALALSTAAPARRRAWISAHLARAHAATGNRRAVLDALDASAAHLAEAEPEGGIDFFNAARLDGIYGASMLLLGDYEQARTHLLSAMSQRDPMDTKGRALMTFDLADCRIGQGEVEEACQLAYAALDMANDSMVQPIINRARGLRSALAPWQESAPVIALAERVDESAA